MFKPKLENTIKPLSADEKQKITGLLNICFEFKCTTYLRESNIIIVVVDSARDMCMYDGMLTDGIRAALGNHLMLEGVYIVARKYESIICKGLTKLQ